MANQQVYQAYPQNKGTLIPGQTISVNNYTVQVERYLSQGGFAHVYLVRTPTPVYNTTHHVLKRIAVSSESMLTEVKKEVDIMRLLKGHPNIVHLIDAAWHKLPNGTYEVFILMEYCPGGGIIDMMNRRLRERLTEAEILQIFVDVCEGVAYMHNSRPPLLHRDLKVENILQSSLTSFKLCDFGSATTVSNPPTNMQEIRALEADLNRHTTLQYRAPEMVDVYSKRPVNEKSDVWALGVLLYKLCYYTTPFEEHGPLAILNVQYRIPPYPVYSQDMNMLIGSMLREHGAQRPTVFELLSHVHRLRGTKSKFSYNAPVPPPLLARPQVQAKSPSSNPLEDVISYRAPPTQPAISLYDPKVLPNPPAMNQGIQARERVLEAIAPMRRGRPIVPQSSSRPSSPQKSGHSSQKSREKGPDWLDRGFETEKDKIWKSATERSSIQGGGSSSTDEAWSIKNIDTNSRTEPKEKPTGFGDDFAEKLWNSSDPNIPAPLAPRLSPLPNVNVTKSNDAPFTHTPLAYTGSSMIRPKPDRLLQNRDKDAFEGLGLMGPAPKAAPTLGEARKLRTGLATMSTPSTQDNKYRELGRSNAISDRHPPSPQSQYLSPTSLQSQSLSPIPTPGSGSGSSIFRHPQHSPSAPSPSPSVNADSHIESRFPSLEELDAQFSPPSANAFYPSAVNDASSSYIPQMSRNAPANRSQYQYPSRTNNNESSGGGGNLLRPSIPSNNPHSIEGVRSTQVTGTAMREAKENRRFDDDPARSRNSSSTNRGDDASIGLSIKPMVIRKHRSSVSMNPSFSANKGPDREVSQATTESSNDSLIPPKLPRRPVGNTPPRDWLTGEDFDDVKTQSSADVAVLRESPRKRASFIETSNFTIPAPSAATQHVTSPERANDEPPSADLSPTVSNFKRAFPPIEIETNNSQRNYSSGLTDNWSPVATRRKEAKADSSSGDEGPEEVKTMASVANRREASKAKGRQSSVHELVHQYGGRAAVVGKDKEQNEQKEEEREREREREERERVGTRERERERERENEREQEKEKEREREREKERERGREKDKERVRKSMHYNVGDYKPQKPRASGLVAPASTLESDLKAPSPTNMARTSMAPSRSPRLQSIALNDKPPPPANSTKPTGRSRPQSMFIFPSKSADSSTSPTTNLMPPQEPKPRATRRTSISDMVQHYETIGGSTGIPAGPPSPIHRPVSTKASTASAENGRIHKVFPEPSKPKPIPSKMLVSNDSRPSGDPLKPRTTIHEPSRRTTTSISRTPTKVQRKGTFDLEKRDLVRSPSPEKVTSRPRRISVKAEPPVASHSRSDTTTTRSAKISISSEPFKSSSPRKAPISLNEDSASRSDERPPSPERPYQGVGRLIDQWQKKSAESDQSRPAAPGKIMTKKPGMLRGEDR